MSKIGDVKYDEGDGPLEEGGKVQTYSNGSDYYFCYGE